MAVAWASNLSIFPAIAPEMQPHPLPVERTITSPMDGGLGLPWPGQLRNGNGTSYETNIVRESNSQAEPNAGKNSSQQRTSKRQRVSSTTNKSATMHRNHKCSICDQAFNRAEHLIRHERSHRKERPFSCDYCDALFTRKDLIKRHMSRMHQDIVASDNVIRSPSDPPNPPESADQTVSSNPAPAPTVSGTVGMVLSSNDATTAPEQVFSMQVEPIISMPEAGSVDQLPEDLMLPLQDLMQQPQDLTHSHQRSTQQPQDIGLPLAIHSPSSLFALDDFLSGMSPYFGRSFAQHGTQRDYGNKDGFTPNMFADMPFDDYAEEGQGYMPNSEAQIRDNSSATLDVTEGFPSTRTISDPVISSRTVRRPQQSLWQGSFEISEVKRAELIADMNQVFCLARVDVSFKMPSCFALERFISAVFDAFVIHMPCIHIPSWQAETAHPSLLLAMIALGANFHYEKELAHKLHRAARLSIINYLELSSFTSKKRPAWVMQALFFTMAFGTWSGNFDAVQEAFSFQANLAHMVRYVEEPGQSWDEMREGADWVEIETMKRTKLALYSYFNNLTMTFNVPPALLNSEIDVSLPCSEGEWTAPTPEALAEYRKRSPTTIPTFTDVLQSLLSPTERSSISCSTFGSYVMIHALLQQIWQMRQILPNNNGSQDLADLEAALRKWQAVWEADPESSISPRNSHGPLAFNSTALLRLAYVRLRVDFARVKSAVTSQNPEAICQSMRTQMGIVKRSPENTKAALYAIHALRIPVKLGMNLVARSGSFVWSLQHHLYSFECCLFLSKWLEAICAPGAQLSWTVDERRVEALVRETIEEVELGPSESEKSMSAKIMYAWASMFDCLEIWGITSVLGSSFLFYADSMR